MKCWPETSRVIGTEITTPEVAGTGVASESVACSSRNKCPVPTLRDASHLHPEFLQFRTTVVPTPVAARSKPRTVFARGFEAWMSVCVYSVCAALCVQVMAFRRADPPSKESYRLCISSTN
jgi:hypothetical protein